MNTLKNINEFRALVKRYETITLKEIENVWSGKGDDTARSLTGYGLDTTCTLCLSVKRSWDNDNCSFCVYGKYLGCLQGINTESYIAIWNSSTPEQLLAAFRNRAKHLHKTYPQCLPE